MTPFDGSALCFIPLFVIAVVGIALFAVWDSVTEWIERKQIERLSKRRK